MRDLFTFQAVFFNRNANSNAVPPASGFTKLRASHMGLFSDRGSKITSLKTVDPELDIFDDGSTQHSKILILRANLTGEVIRIRFYYPVGCNDCVAFFYSLRKKKPSPEQPQQHESVL